jgi:DNA-binding NarL/FixJ family response regulator
MELRDGDLVRRLSSLTPQQIRVLMMLSQGLLNKQIAYELSVSEATVKAHVSAILQKLGVEGLCRLPPWFWRRPALYSRGARFISRWP